VDAEAVLAENIKAEASHPSVVDVPSPPASDIDVTEDSAVDEFMVMDEGGLSNAQAVGINENSINENDDTDAIVAAVSENNEGDKQ
jgi:hypothetical protein